jgi:hypothetical protein
MMKKDKEYIDLVSSLVKITKKKKSMIILFNFIKKSKKCKEIFKKYFKKIRYLFFLL